MHSAVLRAMWREGGREGEREGGRGGREISYTTLVRGKQGYVLLWFRKQVC